MKFRLCEELEKWSDEEIDRYFNYTDRIDELISNEYFGSEDSKEMKQLLFKLLDFVDEKKFERYCSDYELGYPDEENEDEIVPFESVEDLKEFIDDIGLNYQDYVDGLLSYLSYDELRSFYYYSGMAAIDESTIDEEYEEEELDEETYKKIKTKFAEDKMRSVGDIKSKKTTNSNATKVSFEDIEKSATNFAEEVYGFSEIDALRGFILRDGFIVSNNSILNNYKDDRHGNADAKIVNAVMNDLNITVKDIESAVHMGFSLDANGTNGSLLADCLGWIRVNGGSEQYISLPEKTITNDQEYALADWLDNYMTNHKKIKITTYNGQQITYLFDGDESRNIEPYTGEDIANRVMKYYQNGKLEENRKQ